MVLNDCYAGTLTYKDGWHIDWAEFAEVVDYLGGIAIARHDCPDPAKGVDKGDSLM